MSLVLSNRMLEVREGRASAAETLACFEREKARLLRLALMITGNAGSARQAFLNARETALQRSNPFSQQLVEWSKWLTIKAALSRSYDAISSCEPNYGNRQCTHTEHLVQTNDSKLEKHHNFLFRVDPDVIVASLDALTRAVLILRTATRASILDCTQRLDLSANTVLAANCCAMSWLRDMQQRNLLDGRPALPCRIASSGSVTDLPEVCK